MIPEAKGLRIGTIGAGSLGGTVGGLFVEAGHTVMFSSRDPGELQSLVRQHAPRARAGTPDEAAAFGEVVLLAVPYAALPELARSIGLLLKGKIVLDACNPSPSESDPLTRDAMQLGVALYTARLFPGVHLVRAFSAADATSVAASARRRNDKLGVPFAGDDAHAVEVAEALIEDIGCEPVLVGTLADARSFQRHGPGFRANTTAPELRRLLRRPEAA